VITFLVFYAAGVAAALWRTDAPAPTRLVLSLLWPLGPLAFLLTVTLLIAASLVAFPVVGFVVAGGALTWWLLA
jgi:hypothetical protein